MAKTNNEIRLKITVDGGEANATLSLTDENIKELYKGFKYGQQEVNGFTTSLSQGLNNAREMIIGAKEALSTLSAAFGGLLSAYDIQAQAEIRLQTALKQTGNFTEENFNSLIDYASQLQSITLYGDETYISTMAMLQAMGLNTEQTKAAALQSANLATIMGVDLNTAARAMSDLFNGNVGMMGRYIKGLDETIIKSGNTAAIIEHLNSRIGGQAEEAAKTGTAALTQMNNTIGDIQESAGKLFAQALNPLLNAIKDMVGWLNRVNPELGGFVVLTGTLTTAIIGLRTTGLFPTIFSFNTLKTTIAATGSTIRGLYAAIGPGGWILLGISAIITATTLLSSANEGLSESQKQVINDAEAEKLKFDQLTETILDESNSMSARNKAKEEAQKIYPGFLENLSIEETKHNDLIEIINEEKEAYYKLSEAKVLNRQLDLAYEELAAKRNSLISPGFWDVVIGTITSGGNAAVGAIKAISNAAISHAEDIARAEENVNNILKQMKEVTEDTVIDGGGGEKGGTDLFEGMRIELAEAQRHAEAMYKLQTDNDLLLLDQKIKHFDQMIALYEKFNKDTTNLVNKRIEAEAELEKKLNKKTPPITINEELPEDEILKNIINIEEYKYSIKRKTHEDELNDWYKAEQERLMQYEHNIEAQKALDEEYARRKKAIDDQVLKQQLAQTSIVLSDISKLFSEHTEAYKLFAIVQTTIDVYQAAQAAYKAMVGIPIVGPALAAAAAASAITAGLARVSEIEKIQMPGYAEGGRLKRGNTGYIEGYHNEIIAPEKTFVELFRSELRPQIYAGMNYDNNNLLMELKNINKNFEKGIVAAAYLDDKEAKKIYNKAKSKIKKGQI